MRKTHVCLFLLSPPPGTPLSIDYPNVREVKKADNHIIRFVDWAGNEIESNLPYLIRKEPESGLMA